MEGKEKVQMVDLYSQYLKIKEEVDVEIQEVIDNSAFIGGSKVKKFKEGLQDYLNVKHVIPCANGTDALQISFMALNLEPGDEVILPGFTYAALSEVIALLKLKPIFVDVEEDTFNIDVSQIQQAITENTKAIAPVHLFGQCANMEEILAIAKKNNLFVIEDNAQAIGASYTFADGSTSKSGCMGDIGTTSFFPSKNLGCFGDGGAIFTNSDDLAEKIRMVANHGQKIKYFHDIVGVNSRLDNLQAAVLNVKLKHLDTYCNNRAKAAAFYNKAFEQEERIITPNTSDFSSHVFHQYTLKLEGVNRDGLKAYLDKHGVSSMIYYPVALHKQKAYLQDVSLPVSEKLTNSVLSLPIHTEMTQEQLTYIVEKVLEYFKNN
jgi:dTDP-4-amino-4,6-dideoxygalactose transaminase